MNNKKRLLALLAAISMLTATGVSAEYIPGKEVDTSLPYTTLSLETEETASAVVNGAKIDGVPVILNEDGIYLMPLRAVAEGLGYTVNWNGEARSIELIKGAHFITMRLDTDSYAFSRRAPQTLGVAPTLVGDLTYVPVTFVGSIIEGSATRNEDGTYKFVTPSIVTLTAITEDGALEVEDSAHGTVIVKIDEATKITKGGVAATKEDITVGATLAIEYSDAMTASLPPQTTAISINIENAEAVEETERVEVAFEGKIVEKNEEMVVIETADKTQLALIINEETQISKGKDKRIYKLADLEIGMTISGTHAEKMTRSIPAQTVAYTVAIAVEAEVETEAKIIEAEGTIVEILDEIVVIEKEDKEQLALAIGEETVIRHGNDKRIYKLDDLEVGMKISATHGEAMTFSIPPQTAAFSINILD